jgi:hemerythrin superfamily protein
LAERAVTYFLEGWMLIFEQLKRDHDRIKSLMERIQATTLRAVRTRSELLGELATLLTAHSKAEELFFYRAILRGEFGDDVTHDQAFESLEDHTTLETALAEIEDTDPKSEAWMQRFRFFQRALVRHFDVEEKDLFKNARKLVTRETANELGEALNEMRSEVIGGPRGREI